MKKKTLILPLLFFIFLSNLSFSQVELSSEVGVFFGVSSFQTDFGQSHDFPSANASALAFGATHYLNFFNRQYNWKRGTSYFADHFKLKTEFLFAHKTSIRHEPFIGLDPKLDGMRGEIKLFNFGNQLEFYFSSLQDYLTYYGDHNVINPYVSVGVHYSYYDPEVTTTYNGEDPYTFNANLDKWVPGETIYNDADSAFGVSIGAGVRYSMQYFDLVLDTRWQHFFSDEVDGLNAPNDPGNKYNETLINVNLGVIYVFNSN